jgi:hypothetical protein
MEERSPGTISCSRPWALVVGVALLTTGCLGRHAGPRTLAAIGALAVGAGSVGWSVGEGLGGGAHPAASTAFLSSGFVAVAVGLAAVVAAGGWMAASAACEADPDCPEEETCREVPAPPGGVPYKQCVPRG